MARLPKPPSQRQRRNQRDAKLAVKVPEIPPAPEGLLPEVAAAWDAYWRSPVARALSWDADMMSLCRLFELYDQRTRWTRSARRRQLVKGSKGQIVANPLIRAVGGLATEILQREAAFGMNPNSRRQLGIELGDDGETLEDLNEELLMDEINEELAAEDEDPRLQVVSGGKR